MSTIYGSSGIDILVGTEAADTIYGFASGDVLVGLGGADVLKGGDGNDFLDGGAGADNLDGGAGNDNLLGGAGNDSIFGAAGNDFINAGAGSNFIDAGAGNDIILSTEGSDNVNGGAGNDRYVVYGPAAGTMHLTDTGGVDTLDASGSLVGATLDLHAGATSTIGGRHVVISSGGTTTLPVDVMLLEDLTGSFSDDVSTVSSLVPSLVTAVRAIQANSEFGVASFKDKPIGSFGDTGDYVYQMNLALTLNATTFQTTVSGLVAGGGSDLPEASFEALMQLGLRATSIGYRAGAAKFVVLCTDAAPHLAGDFTGVPANNGDNVLNGTPPGTGEDYPSVAQVKAALNASGVFPIFAVTSDQVSTYQSLVTQLGVGLVTTLSSDSSNIVSAIQSAIVTSLTTGIENAVGSNLADTIKGNSLNNVLTGMGGADTINGFNGVDQLNGGSGADKLVGGAGADTLTGGTGNDQFIFNALSDTTHSAPDLIKDFTSGDKIDLHAIDANTATGGNQAFHLGGGGGHAGDIVVRAYDTVHHRTVVDLYVDNNASIDATIWLAGDHHALAAGDFVV